MNHQYYDQRMDFVKSILQLNNLEAKSIETVEYNKNSPFPYNSFIYQITLATPTPTAQNLQSSSSQPDKLQPGTQALPAGTSSLIVRLANHDTGTGLNNTNRVENGVAFASLVRQALAESKYSHIVPDVYAWASTSTGQGFSIMQYMPGTMPYSRFNVFTLQDKAVVLGQMAEILALLQKFELPRTIEKFGGLTFDDHGEIVSAQMTLFAGEPCKTSRELIRRVFEVKLKEADENPVMRGWRENSVRERLVDLMDHGLNELFRDYDVPYARKVLVHNDLSETTGNLLFNPATLQVTALLDFDFSFIGTVADEYTGSSFCDMPGGHLPDPNSSPSELHLRKAMLTGFPTTVPDGGADDAEINWDLAKSWNNELERARAARYDTIPHFEEIANVYWLMDKVSPFELDSAIIRGWKTPEQLEEAREETERSIVRFLDQHRAGK